MQAAKQIRLVIRLLRIVISMLLVVVVLVAFQLVSVVKKADSIDYDSIWYSPDINNVAHDDAGVLIRYGRELIEHTSVYLGPKGKVIQTSNGMNCQNCHLQSGTKPFGNNYGAVASTYPKFRERSGTVEGFEKRINDCIERSLNGTPISDTCREMKAMVAYLKWVGKDVRAGTSPKGSGIIKLSYLERAADPNKGAEHYKVHCASCHGANGQGIKHPDRLEWLYPPLWGDESYNTGAGLFRISKLAGFIRANMPYGVSYKDPTLSSEQSWDIAAFINSMPRPHKRFQEDWPDVAQKPVDHPFGPYDDVFSEARHKYGPYREIAEAKKKK